MERVVCVPARVPIVRIWDPEFQVASDLNVNNTLALENTRMVKTYVEIDPRVRPLAMIIKYWTKQRALNDAGGSPYEYNNKPELTKDLSKSWRRNAFVIYLDSYDHPLPADSTSTYI